ncbi:hypothetical protein TSUD_29410 [Trifolium subterraneum]|uniref:Reverse transcriptase zinc-binding domain-containing protein n=1 Tax=Trifolium subterraneum TaxID=3900 RepID=A0A2Z6NED3_TRISU|nr:hypothetical protein TSUD_29410 [Trifolium subterraneum]
MEDNNLARQLVFKKVWHKFVSLKVVVFVQHMLQNRIPSRENLNKRGIRVNSVMSCAEDYGKVESTSHIFFECPDAYEVWMNIYKWLRVKSVMHIDCIIHFNAFAETVQ